jgi:hypothetical protein
MRRRFMQARERFSDEMLLAGALAYFVLIGAAALVATIASHFA